MFTLNCEGARLGRPRRTTISGVGKSKTDAYGHKAKLPRSENRREQLLTSKTLQCLNVLGVEALRSAGDVELHRLAFLHAVEPFPLIGELGRVAASEEEARDRGTTSDCGETNEPMPGRDGWS